MLAASSMRPPSGCCQRTVPVFASSAWKAPLPLMPTNTSPPALVVAPPIIPVGSFVCQRILPVLTTTAVNVPVPASGYFFAQGPPTEDLPPRSKPLLYAGGFFGRVTFIGWLRPDT